MNGTATATAGTGTGAPAGQAGAATPGAPAAPSLISGAGGAPAQNGAATGTGTPSTAGQAPVVAKSWVEGWVKDGKIDKSAYDHLPEELKPARAMLERYETPDDFLKSFVNHNKLAREKTLLPPPDDAPEADKKAFDQQFRKIFGVPEKPEGYAIQRPADIPEEAWNPEYAAEMAKALHDAAIPPAAAKKLVDANNRLQAAALAKVAQARDMEIGEATRKAQEMINQAFGRDRPKMEQLALQAAKRLGLPTDENSAFVHTPELIILAAKYAVAVGEDKFVSGEGVPQKTPAQEMKEMTSDPTNKYYAVLRNSSAAAPTHPQHALWREADRRLTELAQQQASLQARR